MKNIDRTEGDVNISHKREEWQRQNLNENTLKLIEEDAKYFLHQSLSTPCLNALASCEGSYIFDVEGRKYLDFHGNNVHQVGYGNKKVIEAVKSQLDKLSFSPRRYTNEAAISLAKKLIELNSEDLSRVLFAPGGTTAIGIALKIARTVTGKFKTISYWESFHGASLDAIGIGGESLFRSNIGPLLPGAIQIPFPNSFRNLSGDNEKNYLESLDYLEYVFKVEGDIGAVISEPIRYTTVTIPEINYWQKVKELCDKHNALLIFDEIPTALGRTGKMFVYEKFGVTPDILCLGKGLGGGVFPMAAVVTTEKCNVNSSIAIGHYTHEKSPIGSAAALATIEFIEENDLLNSAISLGAYFMKKLEILKTKHQIIGDVRGIGLLIAVELVKDKKTNKPATDEAEFIMYQSLKRGLSFKVSSGNVLSLMPPLTVFKDEIDAAIEILDCSFSLL